MRQLNFRCKKLHSNEWSYLSLDKLVLLGEELDLGTIDQDTGLEDINGKPIYEGDWVKCVDTTDNHKFHGYIDFADGSFRVNDDDIVTYYRLIYYAMEVVGNVHDNPKLVLEDDAEKKEAPSRVKAVKFRGKRVDTGDWVYGSLINTAATTMIQTTSTVFPIIEETVGQFTGLKDMEGNPIYEGDVLLEDDSYSENYISIVIWDAGNGCWFSTIDEMLCELNQYSTIIANIHDDKTSLKGNKL